MKTAKEAREISINYLETLQEKAEIEVKAFLSGVEVNIIDAAKRGWFNVSFRNSFRLELSFIIFEKEMIELGYKVETRSVDSDYEDAQNQVIVISWE